MEKILNLILTKVEGLEKGQAKLEEGFNSFGNRLDGIDTRLDGIDTRLDGIDTRLDGIDTRLDGFGKRMDRVEKKLYAVIEQTAGLLEFKTETMIKLDKLIEGQEKNSSDIDFLARELGIHNLEINRLKERSV